MKGLRFPRLLATLLVGAALAACGPDEREALGPELARGLEEAEDSAAAWIARGRSDADLTMGQAVALGYLERLRMGLGSPFRLMEYALLDPRLHEELRRITARALLVRTLEGEAYRFDPRALDRIRVQGQAPAVGNGLFHTDLIQGAIEQARDPRGGELAVRLAYSLTAAEEAIDRRSVRIAGQAAAMVRDRLLAREDARRLLRAARRQELDPLQMVSRWRSERQFLVERPVMEPVPPEVEREALELAPVLGASLRDGQGTAPSRRAAAAIGRGATPLLGVEAAERLVQAADSLGHPPQTPLVVALDVHRRELAEHGALSSGQRELGARFVGGGINEERFAAEHALLVRRSARRDPAAGLTALWAAVALRPYAQEAVWFPGFDGPSNRELVDRYGLLSIDFDEAIPAAWRPYYRRMLSTALRDLQRVVPSLDIRGLKVHFGEPRGRTGTLALHDPRTRTVYLPPATGAGTIAHEVAHDLDWQVSLRRYRVRGDYGTDHAVRRNRDRLAASLRGLTTATLLPPNPGESKPALHSRRPAEIFARHIDWFVAVSLASEGRSNGYLSSVQDDLLTGFGTVLPPDVTGSAGAALISILDEVAPVYPGTRDWFLANYGPGRVFTPYDLVRQVLEATGRSGGPMVEPEVEEAETAEPATSPALQRFTAVRKARDEAFSAIDSWVCRAPGAAYDKRLEEARRSLVLSAAGARARGIALERARALGGEDARRWLADRLYGGWDAPAVSPELQEALSGLLQRVREVEALELGPDRAGFRLIAPPDYCASDPLALAR